MTQTKRTEKLRTLETKLRAMHNTRMNHVLWKRWKSVDKIDIRIRKVNFDIASLTPPTVKN